MPVLITGGVSEFSNQLAHGILESRESVIFLHNGGSDNKISNLSNPNLTLINMASTDEGGLRNLINDKKISVVYDVSLTTSVVQKGPLAAAGTLILGITSVLDAIRTSTSPPSLILISGEEVYGTSTLRDETQPLTPVSFVGAAQMSVEAMVHSYAVSYRIPIAIGRVPKILVLSKKDLEEKLKTVGEDDSVNILSYSDAVNGVLAISKLAKSDPPADVFNISNTNDYNSEDKSGFSNQKLVNSSSWKPSEISRIPESHDSELSEIPPVFLVFGSDSPAKNQFLEIVGLEAKKSKIENFQEASDSDVWKEFYSVNPSHLVYFSNESDSFEGDCFTLRTNMATNLYFPWLLASIAEKTSAHFTHFGDSISREESSALAVKGFTQKMLGQFEKTLRLGDKVDKAVIGLIREKKTGGLNNNV